MQKILIIEDEVKIREELSSFLRNNGYEVLIIDKFENTLDDILKMNVDLILMDIQMPHMDVYKATQTIRQLSNKDKTTIPITALTANAFEEDRKKAVAQGMNGHISKPIDVDKIEKVLLSILK